MTNIYKSNDLGAWKTTLGALLNTLDSTGTQFNQPVAKIYGNGKHTAIIELKIELGDADGNLLLANLPTIDAVIRSATLGDYDDTNGFISLGGGATKGWEKIISANCFACPLLDSEEEIIIIDSNIYKNRIENGIAYIYLFISYSADNMADEVSCNLGIKIRPIDKNKFPAGEPFYISKTYRDNGDPISLTALPPLVFTPKDFVWTGTHQIHDGEDDEFVAGIPHEGNFWREITYTVQLKSDDEYPGENRYGNRLFRCAIHDNHSYSKKKINNYANYYFSLKRNGLYAFTGYLWPYNIYKEDQAVLPNGTPLISPPQPNQDPTINDFRMMANGMPVTRVHAPYAKYQLNLSLFCTFGWTTNNAYDYHALDITVYDQYGNSGAVAVDPALLPDQYIDPDATDGLCQLEYFSEGTKLPDNSDNTAHVNLKIVAREKDAGKEYYIQVQEESEDCVPELLETSNSNPPATSEYNLFRFYRNDSGSPDGTRLNSQLTYNIINYHYPTVAIVPFGDKITTVGVFDINDAGWRMIPIWTNNSIAIYRDASSRYLAVVNSGGKEVIRARLAAQPQADLEWTTVVESDETYDGPVDKGAGYDKSLYDIPNHTSGRNSWVGVSDVQMTLYEPGSKQPGYIYPNGLNQASIKVQISPEDAEGNPLTDETAPSIEYVKSVVSAIDYDSLIALERDASQPGWAYSFDSNSFAKHTQNAEAIAIDWDNLTISQNDADEAKINFELYVTCDSNVGFAQKTIGLKIAIWDEAWGDPIVYTCSDKPAGGNAMNFHSPVILHTKNPIDYIVNDLDLIPTSQNDDTQQDDNWPLNPAGRDPNSNMWRLWNYRVALNSDRPAIKFCAIDTNRYNSSTDGGTSCFEKNYSGLYMSEAWLWPTGLVDYNLNPIKDSTKISFHLGNYNQSANINVLNPSGGKSIYISIYYEFGNKSYQDISVQNYFNIKIYDTFGNSGYFHPNTGCIPYTYDKSEMPSVSLLNNGATDSQNLSVNNGAYYDIISMDPDAGGNKYATLGEYNKSKTTYNANINQGNGVHSIFELIGVGPTTFNWECYAASGFYLAHGYSDWLLFAGKPGTERFLFFFKPVWSKRGFLMCTLLDGDEGRAFAYTGEDSKNCKLVPIIENDSSFVWNTIANNPDSILSGTTSDEGMK